MSAPTSSTLGYFRWAFIVTIIGLILGGVLGWQSSGTISGMLTVFFICAVLAVLAASAGRAVAGCQRPMGLGAGLHLRLCPARGGDPLGMGPAKLWREGGRLGPLPRFHLRDRYQRSRE